MTPAQLAGLTITPPDDSDADFTLSVSATSTEAEGDAATTLANLDVTVTGVADASTVNVVAATGAEDSAIALYIGVALNDVDGSESITDITVSGVPAGAQLRRYRQSRRHLDIDTRRSGWPHRHPAG